MNVLNAIGNVGKDGVVAYTKNGDAILNFSFALTSGYGDKQVTSWVNCSVFGKRAETLAPMITKGTRIGITGEIVNRPYTTKEGVEKYSLECRVSDVTLLGKKDGESVNTQRQDNQSNDNNSGLNDDFEDDIAF
jgi:single-strand DNA-binding protein